MSLFGGHHHHHHHQQGKKTAQLKNPRVPLTWQLGALTDGFTIDIDGFAPHNSERFSINLQTGTADDVSSDILLHFNPRFSQRELIRNARFSGQWGGEEKHGGMPIVRNRRFVLQIVVQPQQYTINVDGKTAFTFAHRAHHGLANTLLCDGNLQLNKVSYQAPHVQPSPVFPPFPGVVSPTAPVFPGIPTGPPGGYPSGCIPPPPIYPGPPAIVNPRIPLVTQIPGCLSLGQSVVVNCRVKPNASRFKINLQFGVCENDIALHFNPRYNPDIVVMNSKSGNQWGSEESHNMPAGLRQKGGANVEIRILMNVQDFHVFVNGVFFAAFRHRAACARPLDTLHVAEDCDVNSVSFM